MDQVAGGPVQGLLAQGGLGRPQGLAQGLVQGFPVEFGG
jgi:hypothetical protein